MLFPPAYRIQYTYLFAADESKLKVTYEIQDDAYGLVIAADGNHWVWRGAFPGGQRDPVAG